MSCGDTDFLYPLTAEIYYPIVEQGAYGNVSKQWVLDKIIACSFNVAGRKYKQDVNSEAKLDLDNSLVGRFRCDITKSTNNGLFSLTNIIVTNIKDRNGNLVYNESSGPRSGKSTLFEIATLNPIVGPFGSVEYYKVVIRRSENQAVDL